MKQSTRVGAAAGVLGMALVLAACGGDDAAPNGAGGAPPAATSSGAISQQHNAADVEFAQGMIPHHRQAIAMSELAADRAQSEDVKALAEEISAAQGPEIETMTSFLEAWGEKVPDGDSMGEMGGMDHGGDMNMGGMPGMMSPQQMAELENVQGAEFDRMFLQMMISHHEGAVEMARAEQVDGVNEQAIDLAEQIEATQTAEISRMQDLLSII